MNSQRALPHFSIRSGHDLLLIPFSPASESDNLEVRAQVRNEGADGYTVLSLYLDAVKPANLLHSEELFVPSGALGFAHCFKELSGLSGSHKVIARLTPSQKNRCTFGERTAAEPLEVRGYAPVRLEGGFIMFGPPNDRFQCDAFRDDTKRLTDAQWAELTDRYNAMGIKLIIITVTVQLLRYEGGNGPLVAHYPSKYYPKSDIAATDPVAAVLAAAERNGQKVAVGLGHSYGHKLPNTAEVMEELYALYGGYTSFYGWYDSREEGMSYPSNPDWEWGWTWELWMEKRRTADRLSPVMPILFSPNTIFYNTAGVTVGGIYRDVLAGIAEGKAGWNILVPQDTIGQLRKTSDGKPHTIKEVTEHFSALKEACDKGGVHLWANCEAFNFDEKRVLTARYAGGGMDGPAGYVQQMQALRPYTEKLVAFMLNGFFAPKGFAPVIGGEPAERQYADYLAYLERPAYAYRNAALGKPYTLNPPPDAEFPDTGYSSTDGVLYGGQSFEGDAGRTYGYKIAANGQITVELALDLGEETELACVRVFEHKNPAYAADRVEAYAGGTEGPRAYLGASDAYVNGWLKIVPDKKINARYVYLTFYKSGGEAETRLFLDEVEALVLLGV